MADKPSVQRSTIEGDIALLTFDVPDKGANILSRGVLEELATHIAALEEQSQLAGVILASAKPGVFIAGADIREFAAAVHPTRDEVVGIASRGRQLFERLSRLPFVSVAAIDGVCLGGGAELAIWCDRRLMSDNPKAQFGFPEVKLGLFPGWGGTVRAPRVAGLGNAVELITGGESIDGRQARAMNLVTDVVPADKLLAAAVGVVRYEQQSSQFLHDRQRWQKPIDISETELVFLGATASAYIQQQTKGHYPAPIAALELMLQTALTDAEAAGVQEAEEFARLFGTPINRSLINVFFLNDRNKKDPGVDRPDIKPAKIGSVGVIGAGIMGSGIAGASLRRSLQVTITDAAPASLAKGVEQALEDASYDKTIRGTNTAKLLENAARLSSTTVDAEFAHCDLVIEAVVENEQVKRELYARIEPQLKDGAILASNTSAISIGRLAEGLKHPERFVGIHFFNPVRKMPLVEVIRGPNTSDETIATSVAYAKALGKSPIVVGDGPGFLVNRLLFPYMNEALELILDGATLDQVDRVAKQFGMPMGPITLYDVVGLDTALHVGAVMQQAFPDRFIDAPVLRTLVEAGRRGQKSRAGFFAYPDRPDRGKPDPAVQKLIDPLIRSRDKPSDKLVEQRLFLPMLLEATRVLEAGIVRDVRDVDLGLIFGLGFPPFKGGLLFWADTIGARQLVEQLAPLELLGERFRPTPMLLEMARAGRKFYDR